MSAASYKHHRVAFAFAATFISLVSVCLLVVSVSDDNQVDATYNEMFRYQYRDDTTVTFDVYVKDDDGGSHLAAGVRYVFHRSYDGYSHVRLTERLSYDGERHEFFIRQWRGSISDLDLYSGTTFSTNSSSWTQIGGTNYNLTNGEYWYITIELTGEEIDHIETSGDRPITENGYFAETTVTFYGSGSNIPDDIEMTEHYSSETPTNVSITIPEVVPTYGDRVFLGYGLSNNGEPAYQPGDTMSVPAGSDIILWTLWQEPSANVTFMSNGSVYQTSTVRIGQTVTAPDDPVLYGYTFMGWYTDSSFSTQFDFSTRINGDTTLYAKWEGDLEFTTDPIANGTVTPVSGSPGTVLFSATGSEDYTSLVWDFGDGSTSTNTYVTHYYSEPGTYTATLTVYNGYGEDTTTFTIEVPGDDSGDGVPWTIIIAAVLAVVIIGALIARYLL